MKQLIRIGTRGSKLALWQANYVKDQLEQLGKEVHLNIIKTKGDRIQHLSFDKIEGKGFFTKEIEEALINNIVDLAVHSHKDLETTQPVGLTIAAVPPRASCEDWLLTAPKSVVKEATFEINPEAIIGTGSARRKALLLEHLPKCSVKDLRGNVPTRIQKLRDGQYDAIIVAAAGVERLGLDLSDLHIHALDPQQFVPAPAQGALGLQIRESDSELASILENLHHASTAEAIGIEREILRQMNGGCHVALGAYAKKVTSGAYDVRAYYSQEVDSRGKFVSHTSDASKNQIATHILKVLKEK